METKDEEVKYLNNQHKYTIEKTLLSNLTIEEIKDFITPLYEECNKLEKTIKEKVQQEQNKHSELDELERYFIELQVKMMNWWEQLEILKETLHSFNNHLYSKLPGKKKYEKNYEKVDINEIPIDKVVSMYTKLPSNYWRRNIKCPLHKEKTASFKIYKSTNSFYCFGCQRGWNAINFISEMEAISTKKAFKNFIQYFNLNN